MRQSRNPLAMVYPVLAILAALLLSCDLSALVPAGEVPATTPLAEEPGAPTSQLQIGPVIEKQEPWTGGTLADVSHWLYLIDVNLEPGTVDQIATSEYDMVVLDFIPSEENNTDYPMADVVAQLHNAPHPKLVIAYIDVGEAEDYRTYWEEDWEIGDPEWIVGEDPDGWEGNYPVAFW